jgi:hypothetical protein
MLAIRSRSKAVACTVAIGVVVVIAVACGGSADPGFSQRPLDSSPSTTPQESVVISDANWPNYFSLREVVEGFDTIVVGKVGLPRLEERPLEPEAIASGERKPGPQDYVSLYPVEVLRIIASPRAKEGSTITVYQRGGVIDGVTYTVSGDPLLEVGTTYFLLLDDLLPGFGLDEYVAHPGSRFVVTAEGLLKPNGWEASAGFAAVSGVPYADLELALYAEDRDAAITALSRTSVDEAAERILAAIAEGPLPPAWTPAPWTTPDATPVPSVEPAPVPTAGLSLPPSVSP